MNFLIKKIGYALAIGSLLAAAGIHAQTLEKDITGKVRAINRPESKITITADDKQENGALRLTTVHYRIDLELLDEKNIQVGNNVTFDVELPSYKITKITK